MRIEILGSCPRASDQGIGFTCLRIQTNSGFSILLDCGIGYSRVADESGAITPIENLQLSPAPDYILLTHVHTDHSGFVPWVMRKFESTRLITTAPTLALAELVWEDTARIAKRKGYPGLVPFDQKLFREIRERSFLVKAPGWLNPSGLVEPRIYFGPNGHTRGSAFIVLEADKRRVIFSGDVSLEDTPTIRGLSSSNIPFEIRDADLLFLESTYGARSLGPRRETIFSMNQAIRETLNNGGKVLANALAIERSQDVVLDQVAHNIYPVYLDGVLASQIWAFYNTSQSLWSENDIPISGELADWVRCLANYAPDFRERMMTDARAYSVVASPGSIQGGYSATWAKQILPDPAGLVLQCTYQAEGTPGAELERASFGDSIQIDGETIPIRAKVVRVGISSHADSGQLVKLANLFRPKRIALYHGAVNARYALGERLQRENHLRVQIPFNGDTINI